MNTTTVTFQGCQVFGIASPALWQYDYGQVLKIEGLELPTAYQVEFSLDAEAGDTVTAIGGADGVSIPDELLEAGTNLYAFIFLHNEETDGETEYKITIYVNPRPSRPNETPTPEQQSAIDQAIAALNSEAGKAEAAAESAAEDAETASEAATLAESWAVGGTGTRNGEDTNNSKFWAMVAQQGAQESGYVIFDVNVEDGKAYVTITSPLDEDLSFAVNEAVGTMEVEING